MMVFYRKRVTMFWQQMINAINLGAMYSLLAIGYTMVNGSHSFFSTKI